MKSCFDKKIIWSIWCRKLLQTFRSELEHSLNICVAYHDRVAFWDYFSHVCQSVIGDACLSIHGFIPACSGCDGAPLGKAHLLAYKLLVMIYILFNYMTDLSFSHVLILSHFAETFWCILSKWLENIVTNGEIAQNAQLLQLSKKKKIIHWLYFFIGRSFQYLYVDCLVQLCFMVKRVTFWHRYWLLVSDTVIVFLPTLLSFPHYLITSCCYYSMFSEWHECINTLFAKHSKFFWQYLYKNHILTVGFFTFSEVNTSGVFYNSGMEVNWWTLSLSYWTIYHFPYIRLGYTQRS